MPTGYTATLHDGEQTFEDYALSVARAFGALITMRDDPSDAEIPTEFAPDSYHRKALVAARAAVTRYEQAPDEEMVLEQVVKHGAALRHRDEYVAERDARQARYEAMLVQARAYTPPSPDHEGFAAMLVQHLEESIKFDCGSYEPAVPEIESADDYRARKLEEAQREITRHEVEYAKDVQRAQERTAWVRALRESLVAARAL